jgi:hypothetical protein
MVCVQGERKRLDEEKAKLEEKRLKELTQKRSGFPLWTVWGVSDATLEKDLQLRILKLALDIKNFAYAAAAPNDDKWRFSLEEWTPWCDLALKV